MAQKHRVLVVGVGSIGERHTRCFLKTGRADVSICEVNTELRRRVSSQHGDLPAYSDFDAAMKDPFDAAVVAVPAHMHIDMAIKLAEKKIHTLCEKPLSTSFKNIDRLADAIKASGIKFVVGYTWRSNPVALAFKAALDSGQFGRPVEMILTSGQFFPHYRPAYRNIYYAKRESGGGVVQDALTHMLNLGEWLLGPITKLTADHAHLLLEDVTVEDTAHVIARHGPVLASYAYNQTQMVNESTITIVTTKGTLRMEGHERRWRWMDKPDGQWKDEVLPPMERDTAYINQADAFLDAVEGKGPLRCTLEEALQTLKVNLATLKAADEQVWQTIE